MNAELVAIGSELLLGQLVDTNSAWMAQQLADLGVNLFYKTTVGDNPARMRVVLDQALERSDLVITGGGLGPTQDDLTREVVAQVTGRELVLDQHLLDQIKQRFQRRVLILTPNNERQAYIPSGAIPVENPNGTAPSFIVEDTKGVIISLPGVPFELKWLFEYEVVPYLRKKFNLSETIQYRVLKVADLGESSVDDRIGYLIANSNNPTVGVLAHPGQVDVRIAAKASTTTAALDLIAPVEAEVEELLGKHVFARDGQTMEEVVGDLLERRRLTISVYEDLTGGMVAERFQRASTKLFTEGVIGNSDAVVRRLLASSVATSGELERLLQDDSSLTMQLARTMRESSATSLGVAVRVLPGAGQPTENLGPGETYIALSGESTEVSRVYNYVGRGLPDRTRISLNALDMVRCALMDER